MSANTLTIGALFAGYGGLDLAVQQVWPHSQLAWYAEFDKNASRIMATRFPDTPNHGDVTKIDWATVAPVDIITGGSPCQDLSHAGRRAGMKDGTRSGLWSSMCQAIETIRPKYVIWENVRGALSATATIGDVESCEFCVDDTGGAICGHSVVYSETLPKSGMTRNGQLFELPTWALPTDVKEFSYLPTPTCQDAKNNGAPSQLERNTPPLNAVVTLMPTPVVNDMGAGYDIDSWQDKLDSWQDKHGNNGRGKSLHIEALKLFATPKIGDATTGRTARTSGRPIERSTQIHLLPTPNTMDHLPAREGEARERQLRRGEGPDTSRRTRMGNLREDILEIPLLRTPCAQEAGGGPCHPEVAAANNQTLRLTGQILAATGHLAAPDGTTTNTWGDYAPAIHRWEPIVGRDAPPPTLPDGKNGKHRLSPRFVEWMMGLPDGWVVDVDIPRNAQLTALGNGVVPQQAAAAIRYLLARVNP